MATLSINTQHAPHGSRQPWSPVSSSPILPSASSTESSLSARCRALAHRLGHEAVQDDSFSHPESSTSNEQGGTTTPGSPRRLSPSGQGSPRFSASPLSPRSGHRDLHPPPTPEGSFILETLAEESETPRNETASLDFRSGEGGVGEESSSLGVSEGTYGASATADDEMSSSTSFSGRFGFAASGSASRDAFLEKQELARSFTSSSLPSSHSC